MACLDGYFLRKAFEIKGMDRMSFEEAALRFGISKSGWSRRAGRFGRSRRDVEAAEDQREKNFFFHPKADEESLCSFKRRIMGYETMRISLIYIDERGLSENMAICRSGGLVLPTIDRRTGC